MLHRDFCGSSSVRPQRPGPAVTSNLQAYRFEHVWVHRQRFLQRFPMPAVISCRGRLGTVTVTAAAAPGGGSPWHCHRGTGTRWPLQHECQWPHPAKQRQPQWQPERHCQWVMSAWVRPIRVAESAARHGHCDGVQVGPQATPGHWAASERRSANRAGCAGTAAFPDSDTGSHSQWLSESGLNMTSN